MKEHCLSALNLYETDLTNIWQAYLAARLLNCLNIKHEFVSNKSESLNELMKSGENQLSTCSSPTKLKPINVQEKMKLLKRRLLSPTNQASLLRSDVAVKDVKDQRFVCQVCHLDIDPTENYVILYRIHKSAINNMEFLDSCYHKYHGACGEKCESCPTCGFEFENRYVFNQPRQNYFIDQ